ncbi:TPR-like protein [Rhizopogon vinicolor AM-OR11-026]|uniref:TPR-like protein n=1 Tax=Rhizopogon vinicolor AM-OR11-026 TaxID=1314800 RepID=A0A1B7MSH5_9AGAM|nr:TPR-like protein [Rhizopogon vinicolor AM-OR11-026]
MPLEDPKAITSPPFLLQIGQRFQSLIWTCLDFDLVRSAVFYAERYHVMDENNHDARHLYATALLRSGQPHSGLHLVNGVQQSKCSGCLEIKGKCCSVLGRHRLAREAFEASLQDPTYTPTISINPRTSRAFTEEAATRCRSGTVAMKGNLPEHATHSFRQALTLSPMLWEAFEGLCSLGTAPEIDEIFPVRPTPVKQGPQEEPPSLKTLSSQTATGAGFFTPDVTVNPTLFRGRKTQAFRMDPPPDPRDSIAASESFIQTENSFLQLPLRNSKLDSVLPGPSQPVARPLSSSDETGPAQKRLRSTVRQKSTDIVASKPSKLIVDETSKKARARPALKFANIFSSPGRPSQPVISSRTTVGGGVAKSERGNAAIAPRRSTRLLSGATGKPSGKHPPLRDRRRQLTTSRSRSIDSNGDDDGNTQGEFTSSTSPTSNAQSPPPDASPAPSNWTPAHELAAQEAYELEMADHYIYDLLRRFARATQALSKYDCCSCLIELEQMPTAHQQSSWVLAMVGRAHYERLEYASAERAFRAARALEPYRLGDMEVYSTLLWHLQQNVQLSYLAQELMNINPQSPQAWIAVGNLFSLQKERSQALACFRRAAEIDPSCAYAYTLSGHESIDEDLDKAIGFFETALRADPRHYNAWYGLGTCYLRMSKIRLAEYHYRKAVEIHPNNAVLLGCIGMAVERRGDKAAAHGLFDQAVRVAPDNALVRYRRAKILITMKRYTEALEDLLQLRDSSPEESNVVFQIAKVYRLMGDEVKSAHWLAIARDTSPKSANKLKKLIDTVKDEEGRDDQMDEG